MLTVTTTPHHTGAKISGDYFDLEELNQAIYKVIGDEEKYYGYEGARQRILAISFQVRQAALGERNVEFVFNALHDDTKKRHKFIAPDKNIYFSAEVLWPELLFAVVALKDFSQLRSNELEHPKWDLPLHTVAKFQSLVLDCLQGYVSAEDYNVIQKAFDKPFSVEDYAIQYIDMLNVNYIGLSAAQREKALPVIAMKVAVKDKDYLAFHQQIIQAAAPGKRAIHDIAVDIKYPEEIEW